MAVMHPHYLSHPHPPNLPPHPYPSYPHWGPSSLGGGLLCGVEKVEEDQRWHRLRTITSGWDSEDDETDDRKLKVKIYIIYIYNVCSRHFELFISLEENGS